MDGHLAITWNKTDRSLCRCCSDHRADRAMAESGSNVLNDRPRRISWRACTILWTARRLTLRGCGGWRVVSRLRRPWCPADNATDAGACVLVVGNAFEAAAQFNGSREFTALLIGSPDRGGVVFGDKEHSPIMGERTAFIKTASHDGFPLCAAWRVRRNRLGVVLRRNHEGGWTTMARRARTTAERQAAYRRSRPTAGENRVWPLIRLKRNAG